MFWFNPVQGDDDMAKKKATKKAKKTDQKWRATPGRGYKQCRACRKYTPVRSTTCAKCGATIPTKRAPKKKSAATAGELPLRTSLQLLTAARDYINEHDGDLTRAINAIRAKEETPREQLRRLLGSPEATIQYLKEYMAEE